MSNEWLIVQEAFSVRVEADDEIIYVRHLPDWNDESYASELKGALTNAALIHGARDLLDSLKSILDQAQWDEHLYLGPDLENQAYEAIKKSTTIQ